MLTRRQFISASLATVAVAAFGSIVATGEDDTLEQRKELTRRLHGMAKSVPMEYRVGISSVAEANEWAAEIIPYFQYEGIMEVATPPVSITFDDFSEGGANGQNFNHVLARATCMGGDVVINDRQTNPISSWYDRPDSVQTLAHELVHIQGVCLGDSQLVETTAQILSFEVLSAMLLHGNKKVAYSLFSELSDMGLASIKADAVSGIIEWNEYLEFRNELLTDPMDIARQDKSDMYWNKSEENKARLEEILIWYNKKPFELILQGLKDGMIDGNDLFLPSNWIYRVGDSSQSHYDQFEVTEAPTVIQDVNDQTLSNLVYVVEHGEELVASL